HLVAVLEQRGKDIVLGGDGGAVAPDQAVVDGNGVGLGAVLVIGLLMGSHDGRVELELAFLGVGDSGVAIEQAVHGVVGGGIVHTRIVEVVFNGGDGADDQLAGGLGGAGAGGSRLSGGLGRGLGAGRRRGGFLSVVGDSALAAAGRQRDRHAPRQQQGRNSLCFHVFLSPSSL